MIARYFCGCEYTKRSIPYLKESTRGLPKIAKTDGKSINNERPTPIRDSAAKKNIFDTLKFLYDPEKSLIKKYMNRKTT
jgi:hypothetical protein